jgi:hypothetical protein
MALLDLSLALYISLTLFQAVLISIIFFVSSFLWALAALAYARQIEAGER